MAPRRKSALEELIRTGWVGDGELLRYKSKQGQLLAVGRAREGGIEVQGVNKLLGYTAFEDISGSKYHRPAEHTHTSTGRTLQSLALLAAGGADAVARGPKKDWEPPVELLEDENDDLCHICGLGGDLVCCETCPAVFHAGCLGLGTPPEGDFFCPRCTCPVCGAGGGADGIMPTGCDWASCLEFVGPGSLGQCGRPHISAEGPAPKPTEAGPAAEAGQGSDDAAAGAGVADGQHMQVDGQEPAAAAGGVADFSQLAAATSRAFQAVVEPPEAPAGREAAARVGDGAAVGCPVTYSWSHLRCFPAELARLLRQGSSKPCISSVSASAASRCLAMACAAGLLQLGCSVREGCRAGGDGVTNAGDPTPLPLSLLVVRGAAVASPGDCRGNAPGYDSGQRRELQAALSAALLVLRSCYELLPDSRTGEDMLPWLVRGAVLAGGQADYSSCHTALLYAGQTVVAAAVFRSFGDLAELPLLAVRPELQRHNGLGRLLLAAVEQLLLAAGAKARCRLRRLPLAASLLTPALTADGAPYLAAAQRAVPAAEPGSQDGAQPPPLPPPLQGKWGYQLAPAAVMRQAARHPLLRMPGVLLACKQLAPGTVLPPPRLPQQLRFCAAPALDPKPLLRDGWLAGVAPAVLPAAAARAPAPPQPAVAARKPGRPPKPAAAAVKKEEAEEAPAAAAASGQAAGWVSGSPRQQQLQLLLAGGAPVGAGMAPPDSPALQLQQQALSVLLDPQAAFQQAIIQQQQQQLLQQHQQQLFQPLPPDAYAQMVAQFSLQQHVAAAAAAPEQLHAATQQLGPQQQHDSSIAQRMLRHLQQQQQYQPR